MNYSLFMTTPAERLRALREGAGYEHAKDAALAIGVNTTTYQHHENENRGITKASAMRYARFFRSTPEWILYGRASESEPTIAELETMLRDTLEEVLTTETRIADLPRIVAPALYEQLSLFRSDRQGSKRG